MTKRIVLYISESGADKDHVMLHALKEIKDIEVKSMFRLDKAARYFNDSRSIFDKLFDKLGLPLDRNDFNLRIVEVVKKTSLNYIFIVKGVRIFPKTLQKLKKNHPSCKLIVWSLDDMYAKHNQTLFYRFGLKYYDLVVTTKSYNCNSNELPALGAKKILFQNNSFSPNLHRPCKCSEKQTYNHDVIFIGTAEEERAKAIYFIANNGIKVHVYGTHWDSKIYYKYHHDNIIFHNKELIGPDYRRAISCSKICLSFLRKINRDVQTARTVEIPACGGFMIGERTIEQSSLFKEGFEAEYFSTNPELLQKVRYYLNNELQRSKIAKNARNRCLASGYSFVERAKEILNFI